MMDSRRYDIDWLRVIAIGLLVIYHIAIAFQPWGVFIGFIQNDEALTWIWAPMSMLNVWRIPLLFFVSGMGVYFAIQKRDWKALLMERTKRILLPFIFGALAIVPLHTWLWSDYYNQTLSFGFNPAHLWFLGNIFSYVLIFTPLFFVLKKYPQGRLHRFLGKLMRNPLGLLLILIPFVIEALVVAPESFEIYAMTAHGFWIGMVAFVSGFICVYTGQSFWNTINKWRWLYLSLALLLFAFRAFGEGFNAPNFMKAIESNFWIFTVLGFGFKHLNKPSQALSYLSQSAYPIYILHMFFLYLASWLLFPLDLPAMVKFCLVVAITFSGCFGFYEFGLRRIKYLRPLFGLKI